MIKFIDIDFGSSRYNELLDLRYKVLLQPLGLKFLDSFQEQEAGFLHIGCIDNSTDKLVGGLILAPLNDKEIRVMQVAIDSSMQRTGLGKKLVEYAHDIAKKAQYETIIMHAMLSVVGFYETLGYQQDSDLFDEKGISFIKMIKTL